MSRSLPPFSAIKAFEAAARHGSFARAAQELDVTATAISQHVKGLEKWLGKPLFVRRSNAVELTEHGRDILDDVTRILDDIASLLPREREPSAKQTILIAAPAMLIDGWLAPALAHFYEDNPGLLVTLQPADHQKSLQTDNRPDFLISDQDKIADGLLADFLFDDALLPVCSAQFRDILGLRDRTNWHSAPLIHDATSPDDWQTWAKRRAPDLDVHWNDGARYANHWLAIEAARQAHGMFMAHEPLISGALDEGSLVALDETPLSLGKSVKLIRRRGHASPAAIQFRAWLLERVRTR
ncbi:LysR family transcriptional regulator [Cohaesibacter sp. ES.047]|uniref:LysR family transcriptional regulator n=1 Tax=Cohaesibacter sp. ES.047 TaxID=1798205 RepID=UPI00156103D1|nr:LysR family transcriptional regulator [Cohaesibacter sp. ES.047]